MFSAIYLLDLAGSAVHFYSLSLAIASLAAHDPLGAVWVTVVAVGCLIILAATFIGTEVAKFAVREYVRKRELREQQKLRNLEDKNP